MRPCGPRLADQLRQGMLVQGLQPALHDRDAVEVPRREVDVRLGREEGLLRALVRDVRDEDRPAPGVVAELGEVDLVQGPLADEGPAPHQPAPPAASGDRLGRAGQGEARPGHVVPVHAPPVRPIRWATAAASTRPLTPSLARMFDTCTLAVFGLMNSALAIWPLDRPAATRSSTSRSRSVSPNGTAGSVAGPVAAAGSAS